MAALDDIRKAGVRRALESDQVAAAYLFGSQARERPGPLSDVDLGVWASPGLTARERFDLRLRLASAVERVLGDQPVDLVVLDDASPLLRHRAWRDGCCSTETRAPGSAARRERWSSTSTPSRCASRQPPA